MDAATSSSAHTTKTAGQWTRDVPTSFSGLDGDGSPDSCVSHPRAQSRVGQSVAQRTGRRRTMEKATSSSQRRPRGRRRRARESVRVLGSVRRPVAHTLVSPNSGASFGHAVAGVQDATGDGKGDILVGANGENSGANASGRAYLFDGATGGLVHQLVPPNPEFLGVFGWSVAGVPDATGETGRLTKKPPSSVHTMRTEAQ